MRVSCYAIGEIIISRMDSQTLKTITQKLHEEKARLEEELKELGHRGTSTGAQDADFPSFGDKEDENAAEVALYGDNLSLEQDLDRELRDVKNALTRINDGSYGTCKYCKKEIALPRLLARPESSSCVHCKEQFSRG